MKELQEVSSTCGFLIAIITRKRKNQECNEDTHFPLIGRLKQCEQ